ncbi:hypothetical protein EV379_2809 [Microterricola gilva]|uniref:DUF4190 domain-containing protein n=1 Tax=Microterricola gilva TaxID=393267 RepID=A0A4Q8AP48_9MICO|nr:hypothetical protein EV379_2809 [Microterricola gilva]
MRVLIVVQGAVTLLACLFLFPLGAAMVLTNGVLAVATRGADRRLFAGIAIAGALLCIVLALVLSAVSTSSNLGPVVRLED